MKQMKHWLMIVAVLLCSVAANAFDVGNFSYNVIEEGKTVEVTSRSDTYSGDIIIPSTVTYNKVTYNVTKIGWSAFSSCPNLTSVTIPEGVTSIDGYAFSSSDKLTTINIPKSVTSIEAGAFLYCKSLTTINIPESVTSIGEWAFNGCTSLTAINIPNGVTSIGEKTFYNCSSLTAINIPKSVTSIGNEAFYNCFSLTSITVAAGNTIYDSRSGCNAIIETASNTLIKGCSNTVIPEGVTSIRERAFYNCSSLASINIPESVKSIGNQAFYACQGLTAVTLSEGVESIGDQAFHNCTSLTDVTLSDGVESIGNEAFYCCTALTAITLPESVTNIGNQAFASCNRLTAINIPEGVTNIGEGAFSSCGKLTNITIPEGIKSIEKNTFRYCYTLTAINIPPSVTYIGEGAFYGCSNLTAIMCEAVTPPTIAAENTFYQVKNATIYVPSSSVDNYRNATDWKKFTIRTMAEAPNACGENLTWRLTADGQLTIEGTGAMTDYSDYSQVPWKDHTTSIKKIVIGEGVTNIGDYAFYGCSSLTAITIPEGVTSIGEEAFCGCSSLSTITIPESVTSIGAAAFYGCSSLTSITIPEGVTNIGVGTFYECTKLTSIIFPEGVTSIGDWAFYRCSSLTSITLPEGVTSIGDYAFDYCYSLTTITLPEVVTSIGSCAFGYCTRLTSITIPENVTSIGTEAFGGCISLTDITISASSTNIASRAFYKCSNLASITSKATTPPNVDQYAFYNVNTSIPVYVPASSVDAYKGATGWSDFTNIQAMPIASGKCGDNITWKLSNDGELKIEGTGAMPDYSSDNAPWNDYKEQIKAIVIGSGITHIGSNAFYGCSSLTTITCQGATAPTLGTDAFAGISDNAQLIYPSSSDYSSLLPNFKGNKFTMTYMVDGKLYGEVQSYACGEKITAPTAPTKEGHKFKEWLNLPETMPAQDLVVNASFTVNSYTITFDTDGGSAVAAITKNYGESITAPDNPTKTGYKFDGWDRTIPSKMPAENVTITAKWKINQYTITFNTDGGAAVEPITQDYNTAVTAPDKPTKEGYTFIGWNPELPETMPAENITVTAQWKYTPIIVDGTEYSVTENKHAESITYTRKLSKADVWNALYVPFEIPVTEEFLQNYDVAYFNDIHSYDDYIGDQENGVKGKDGEIDVMEMELLRVQQGQILNANYPYLIRAKNENALDMELKVEDATLYRTVETTVSCSSVFMRFDLTGIYTTQTSGELKGEFNVYAMSGGGWKMALSDSQQLKPFRLYLKLTTIAGSPVKVSKSAMKAISIRVDGEEGTTTIDNTELTIGNAEDVVYDLQGRRVANPGKGMYIVNGKKVIFK